MLKSLKKNQVVIYVIALMLVAAGYLNYTSGNNIVATNADPEVTYKENLADIGDATLVNSNSIESSDSALVENEKIQEQKNKQTEEQDENTSEENIVPQKDIQTQEASVNTDDYFSKSKLERETMYSQMLETYQNIVNSNTVSEEQRSMATQEISNINNTKNAIMICENLLSTKGFSKNIVFVNGNSVSVVIQTDGELATNQVAQVQNIITREMNVEIENINITEKN